MQIFQFAELKHFEGESEQRCRNNCVDLYEENRGGRGENLAPAAAFAHYPFWQPPCILTSLHSQILRCLVATATAPGSGPGLGPGVLHQVGIFRTRINFMAPL